MNDIKSIIINCRLPLTWKVKELLSSGEVGNFVDCPGKMMSIVRIA